MGIVSKPGHPPQIQAEIEPKPEPIAGPTISFAGAFAVKITDDKVREIRKRVNAGEKGYLVAQEMGISQTMVSHIMTGKRKAYVV
jgi:hypothetical protein